VAAASVRGDIGWSSDGVSRVGRGVEVCYGEVETGMVVRKEKRIVEGEGVNKQTPGRKCEGGIGVKL
jgi:hypothetical protein